MFRFQLDGSSGVPPYLQLVHQVRQSLLLGYLREGDRLPTVKELAGDLAINPNTVVRPTASWSTRGWRAGGRDRARSSRPPWRRLRLMRASRCALRLSNGSVTPRRPG